MKLAPPDEARHTLDVLGHWKEVKGPNSIQGVVESLQNLSVAS